MKFYKGYTLLGLMVATSLSSLLLWVIVEFYVQTQLQNKTIFLQLDLQSRLERILQTMKKDIRRSGFIAKSNNVKQDNFEYFLNKQQKQPFIVSKKIGEHPYSCFLFTYDLDESGCIGGRPNNHKSCLYRGQNNTKFIQQELFGYRLNKGVLETRMLREKQVKAHCSQLECQSYLSPQACNLKGWHKFSDNNEIKITILKFSWLKQNELLEIELAGYLKKHKNISYQTKAIVPLLNRVR